MTSTRQVSTLYALKQRVMQDRSPIPLDAVSLELRRRILQIVRQARRGHIGSAFSIVEILRVLYDSVLRFRADEPRWADRDRFVLSKGHGCLALYVMLAEKGFIQETELARFCQLDSRLGGHPETHCPGVEHSTGSLGHGLPFGLGVALAAKMDRLSFRTFVLVGDGECDEGSVWEAALSAAKHSLGNLTVLVDYNHMQSYGRTHDILELEPFCDKWRAFGFDVHEVDGHDVSAIERVLSGLFEGAARPHAVICQTVKGKGVDFIENNAAWHHKTSIDDALMARLFSALEPRPAP